MKIDQRNKTIQVLHDFSKTYLETQILITCRVAANDYSFTEFTYIEMADFSSTGESLCSQLVSNRTQK